MKRAAFLLGLCVAASAAAHPQFVPTGRNRYLKMTLLGGGEVRLAYTVMVGEVPAARARRAADRNGDGQVDAGEQAAVAAALRDQVERGLTVEIDGARRPVAWEPPVAGFSTDTRVGPLPYSIDLVGRVAAGGGEHRARVDDATPIDDLAETEIRIEEGPPGTHLAGGWQGREDAGKQYRFLYQGPKFSAIEDRSIGFRFVDETVRARRPRRPLPIALAGALVAALAGAATIWRVRRKLAVQRRMKG